MAANKKPRRAYRPRVIHAMDALRPLARAHVVQQIAQPLADDQTRDLGLQYHSALEAIRTGTATWADCDTLANAANIALVLSERGIGGEYLSDVHAAQEAIVRMVLRGNDTGRFVLDGPGLQAVSTLVELHDAQLEACTRADAMHAIREVKRRHDAGQVIAGSRAASVVEAVA